MAGTSGVPKASAPYDYRTAYSAGRYHVILRTSGCCRVLLLCAARSCGMSYQSGTSISFGAFSYMGRSASVCICRWSCAGMSRWVSKCRTSDGALMGARPYHPTTWHTSAPFIFKSNI